MHRSNRLLPVALAALVLVGCANSGVPKGWDEQADESGRGLAERNFVDACVEANDNLSISRATSLCECVLAEVQGSATYADFEKLNDHFKNNSDTVTESGLADLFPWFTNAVASCAT
ncbi:MAG: hypothetical protein H8E59_03250 [Actinobacteria bacterium]|nr:hypothetical protein [Actinomycetota bacterium]